MWLMFRPWSSAWPIKLNHFSCFPSQPLIGKLSLPDGLSDFSLNPLWRTWTMSRSLLFLAIALPPLCLYFTLVLQTLLRLLFCITQVGFVFMGPPFQSLLPGLLCQVWFFCSWAWLMLWSFWIFSVILNLVNSWETWHLPPGESSSLDWMLSLTNCSAFSLICSFLQPNDDLLHTAPLLFEAGHNFWWTKC